MSEMTKEQARMAEVAEAAKAEKNARAVLHDAHGRLTTAQRGINPETHAPDGKPYSDDTIAELKRRSEAREKAEKGK